MNTNAKLGAVALTAAGVWASLASGGLPSFLPALILLGLAIVLLRDLPGWWRGMSHGLLAGLIAGIVVLTPGFRLAMRAVAIAEPTRQPMFSFDGTLVILLTVGCLAGAVVGAIGAVNIEVWRLRPGATWAFPALLMMALLFLVPDLRRELMTLGAGPWANIAMFGMVSAVYGWLATRLMTRFGARRASRVAAQQEQVPA